MNSRVRIAILAEFPISALEGGSVGRGGGQGCTWLPQLAQEFEKLTEFEIHWVILDRTIRRTRTIEALGQQFHQIPSVRFTFDLALDYLPARTVLKRALHRIRPHVIHAWGTELIYPAALRDFKGPRILSMQGVLTEYRRIGGLPSDWRWRKMIASEPAFIRSATVVTSESQWGMDRVREIHPAVDCRMVEYGVHPDFYQIDWRPDPETPYLVYVGGSGTRKGFDTLVAAMKLLPHRQWELRLAGDEDMKKALTGIERVTSLGLLPWDEMRRQLQQAWAFVLPTRGDTSPNSVKEARVIGLPVITTRHGGQSGYIRDGVNGRIIDPEDPASLAAAMEDVMGNFERATTLGKARHQEDRDYLNPARTADGFGAIYRELAESSILR